MDRGIEMTTNNVDAPVSPKAKALILGNHDHISKWVIDVIRTEGYDGKNSTTVEGAIELASQEHFDVLMIGGAVTNENADLVIEGVKKHLPNIGHHHRDLYAPSNPIDSIKRALANISDPEKEK
jgi:hypothetical protein